MRIHSISIKGFKACQELVFEPGRVNVFIGSNGSGKSTVLEAVGILSAALADRVDNAALSRRGIRLSANELYQSSFQSIRRSPTIDFGIKWDEENNQGMEYRVSLNAPSDENTWRYHSEVLLKNKRKIDGRSGASASLDFKNDVGMLVLNHDKNAQYVQSLVDAIRDYGIFQPNTPTLRGIQTDQYQNEPVGLCGGRLAEAIEGLLVEDIDGNPMFGSLYMDDVLDLIDWSVGIKVTPPKKSSINASVPTSRRVIEFTDKYMRSDKKFTAYDASEGALYVLLMLCLAMHKKAPDIFSIDNFDQAMNPRLAKAVTNLFCNLAIENHKTVFMTTHNPLVLDGLNLHNDDIRLFAVSRTRKTGYTQLQRVMINEQLENEGQSLSRLWVNGRLGGVPNLE